MKNHHLAAFAALSGGVVLDSATLSTMERLSLGRELSQAIKSRDLAPSPLEKLKASNIVQELRRRLGMATKADATPQDAELSDKASSENYRWKDTAYIAGSRKEMAQQFIMRAKRDGQRLNVGDIDWDEMAENPRLAEKLITRDNVFGRVPWKELSEAGMPSRVGYMISRVYANTEKQPISPMNPESQKNYIQAMSNLRERMEACRDMNGLVMVLNDIITSRASYRTLRAVYGQQNDTGGTLEEAAATLFGNATKGVNEIGTYDERVWAELGERFTSWVGKSANTTLRKARREARAAAWETWCTGFDTGTSTDAEGVPAPDGAPKTPKAPSFQLEAADDIERIGGTEIDLESSQQLQDMFGLRGIQSGNWVLKDKAAAEFHMKNAAAAMLDMSDVLGIDPKHLGLNGNLALSFGARGKKGALAHYEPSTKVINITKMKGGGSLGHEYFHALDNLIKDLSTQTVGSAGYMGTSKPDDLPDADLAKVFKALQGALQRNENVFAYDFKKNGIKDLQAAKESSTRVRQFHDLAEAMMMAFGGGDYKTASKADVDKILATPVGEMPTTSDNWFRNNRDLYVASVLVSRYFALGDASGVVVNGSVITYELDGFGGESLFYKSAIKLDGGKAGKYWSKDYEMAARAFSAYLQDRLAEQGRKNDYLAYSTQGGKGRAGEIAYPQGIERKRVNAAFDALFATIRDKKVLELASQNTALMHSLFNKDTTIQTPPN